MRKICAKFSQIAETKWQIGGDRRTLTLHSVSEPECEHDYVDPTSGFSLTVIFSEARNRKGTESGRDPTDFQVSWGT